MTDFARARQMMVDTQLRTYSITDRRILGAMGRIARESFVPSGWQDLAYIDEEIPLGVGDPQRYLSAPAPLARLIQLAEIAETDHVLVLGCATGYSAAVVAALAATVVAVEPEPALADAAKANLRALGLSSVDLLVGDMETAAAHQGPFDVIVVEGVLGEVPKALHMQLKEGGRLVLVLGSGMTAVANIFVRRGRDMAGRADFNARLPILARRPERESFVF